MTLAPGLLANKTFENGIDPTRTVQAVPPGAGTSNTVTGTGSVERDDFADRVERSLIDNQMRVFEQMKQFMESVNKRIDALSKPVNAQGTTDFAGSNPQPAASEQFRHHFMSPLTGDFGAMSLANSDDSEKCRLDRWHINYDGTTNVGDFLFQVDTCQASSRYSDKQITSKFHTILSGRANVWFWRYLRKKPEAKLTEVKSEMRKEFGRPESDVDIYMRLLTRKQGSKESFDEFYNAIITINDRMKEPFDNKKLASVIRSNVRDKLGEILLSADVKTLEQVRNKAREAERYLAKRVSSPKVHEITFEEEQDQPDLEGEEIAAFAHQNRVGSLPSYSCHNCDEKGHSYLYCPSHTRNLFCYFCGAKGVTTVECGKHAGNFRRDEKKGWESRPSKTNQGPSKP